MNRTGPLLLAFALAIGATACTATSSAPTGAAPADTSRADSIHPPKDSPGEDNEGTIGTEDEGEGILVAYFSRTGSTGEIAGMICEVAGGDLVQIETIEPYPSEYNDVLAQALEEQDTDHRPALATQIESIESYDTIFIGYPIWHGDVPMAILSFLEAYDWNGKQIIPFCTHGGGGAYGSFASVENATPGAEVGEGFAVAGSAASRAAAQVADWLEGLGFATLPVNTDEPAILYLSIGERTLTATLEDNSSARALRELLAEGPVTIDMRDYASMEKVGDLGTDLPTNDVQLTTGPGDLILYGGNSFVIYYATNSWSLTLLGKIDDVTEDELREILGDEDVTATLSLTA